MADTSAAPFKADVPLIFDFDGTLHLEDISWMGFVFVARKRLWVAVWLVLVFLVRGRARMKLRLEAHVRAMGWRATLKMDPRTVALLEEARRAGRDVVVATGSAQGMVEDALRDHGLPVPVLGTDGRGINLVAHAKAGALVEAFGREGFDYAGNSVDDLPVWRVARHAIVVNAKPEVENWAKSIGNVLLVLPKTGA